MEVNSPPFSPASAMPSLIHLSVPARRGRSRGGRCTKRSALSNGRPASSIVASWLNRSALTLKLNGVKGPPGIAHPRRSPMHYQVRNICLPASRQWRMTLRVEKQPSGESTATDSRKSARSGQSSPSSGFPESRHSSLVAMQREPCRFLGRLNRIDTRHRLGDAPK